MASVLVSDTKQDYDGFLIETISKLRECDVTGIAIVALCGKENITAYWNMGLRDKSIAESEIRYDAIDQLILANRDRYLGGEED